MLPEVSFGVCLGHVWPIFLLRSGSKNLVDYSSVFVLFAKKNYFLQHAENRVNTVMFAPKGRKHRTYRGFWLEAPKTWIFTVLFAPMVSKKT